MKTKASGFRPQASGLGKAPGPRLWVSSPEPRAPRPEARGRSEVHLEVDVEHIAVRADGIRVVGVPDRRFLDVHKLRVQTDAALLQEIPVRSAAHLPGIA